MSNTEYLHIRCTPEQKKAWQAAADKDQRTLASWVKTRLSAIAEKELKR